MDFNTIKKLFPRAHVEPAGGTAQENRKYCSKDGQFIEHGECPMDGATKTKRNYQAAKDLAIQGKVDDIEANMYVPYYTTLLKIASDHAPKVASIDTLANEWHMGPTGTGKSRLVREKYPDAFIKDANQWFDGYQGEETIIIEDIDVYDIKLGRYVKLWGDHYPFPANFKHAGKRDIRPTRVLITSNYHPRDIWSDPRTHEPILRRYNLIDYTPKQELSTRDLTPLKLADTPGFEDNYYFKKTLTRVIINKHVS